MWLGSSWPIILLFGTTAGSIAWELAYDWCTDDPINVAPRGKRAAVSGGVQRALPVTLITTFFLVTSTSTTIFKTFLCDPFEFSASDPATHQPVTRRYLHDDLALDCDTSDYRKTWNTAVAMVFVWPLGVPLLYFLLLFTNRDAILTRTSTPMTKAISFLVEDYEVSAFWWEPLESECSNVVLNTVRYATACFSLAR